MFIYVIGPEEGFQKIGISGDPQVRLRTLQTGNPLALHLHHAEDINPKKAARLERLIHRELNHKREKGEWFNLTPKEAKEFVIFFAIRYNDDPLI